MDANVQRSVSQGRAPTHGASGRCNDHNRGEEHGADVDGMVVRAVVVSMQFNS